MPRLINPVQWRLEALRSQRRDASRDGKPPAPLISLVNARGHRLHVHPVNARLVRVVHTLPVAAVAHVGYPLRNHVEPGRGVDGLLWEPSHGEWSVRQGSCGHLDVVGEHVRIHVDFSHAVRLAWFWRQRRDGSGNRGGVAQDVEEAESPFLEDFKTAYTFDALSGRVFHYVCREAYMPLSESEGSANEKDAPHEAQDEFVYGLGETKGRMLKSGKRYVMEGRDSLGADPEETDPLYKLCPYYAVYKKRDRFWYGLYYNYLGPTVFDFGAEHDFSTGNWRSFSAENGPLDYYVMLGEEEPKASDVGDARAGGGQRPTLAGLVTQLAHLVTPGSTSAAGERGRGGWQVSPTLPPLSQFGYLASSLTLSERHDAQAAVVEYVEDARRHGFPVDAMHLSSGYCQDPTTGERNYFRWNEERYPEPAELGRKLEQELGCQVIINVKPWLLESHQDYVAAVAQSAFVRAAPDARPIAPGQPPQDRDRCGPWPSLPARTIHWSVNMGETAKGSYFDFSREEACALWQQLVETGVLHNNISAVWIDNNEFSTLRDDAESLGASIDMWTLPDLPRAKACRVHSAAEAGGYHGNAGEIGVGTVGRGVLTMGMARATYQGLLNHDAETRPVVVTRSSVPGMPAFAHGTWSGDNSTTWKSLRWCTKLTLSVGLSFGHGLYGHDVGGFAGAHSPSAELLVRWCQQAMWHTRFTVHSWKKVSTTLWMYDDVEGITDILRATVAYRYRLIPTLYSLYVREYHRKGWPVLRPLLWYHSSVDAALTQDDQFLLGSHVLVAPVTQAGARTITFNLPCIVDGADVVGSQVRESEKSGTLREAWWCELDTGKWHAPTTGISARQIVMDAPLSRCPALVRAGGILVLGGQAHRNAYDEAARTQRTALIFPAPADDGDPHKAVGRASEGEFYLVEDDGRTNAATDDGGFSELRLWFASSGMTSSVVEVGVDTVHAGYRGSWRVRFQLPPGDRRTLRWKTPDSKKCAPSVRMPEDEPAEGDGFVARVVSVE